MRMQDVALPDEVQVGDWAGPFSRQAGSSAWQAPGTSKKSGPRLSASPHLLSFRGLQQPWRRSEGEPLPGTGSAPQISQVHEVVQEVAPCAASCQQVTCHDVVGVARLDVPGPLERCTLHQMHQQLPAAKPGCLKEMQRDCSQQVLLLQWRPLHWTGCSS